jgi:ABC-type glycerol-3-phosphate transport system substrate-binding protein
MARVRIKYWEKWGGREREAMDGIVQAFNRSQEMYEVLMEDAGDWSSSPDLPRFLAAQDGGTPPDVIGLEDQHIADLASIGAIAPLQACADLSDFRHEFTSLGIYRGRLYGAPISADVVTLYVNLSAVAGTPFAGGQVPTTLDEMDRGLAELAARGKTGFVPAYPGWWPHAWAWFFGGSWVDEDGRFTPARPENIKAFEWVLALRERLARRGESEPGWPGRLLASAVNPVSRLQPDPFLSGEVAMVFEGDWLVRRLVATRGLDWRPAAFPSVDAQPSALVVGDVLAVPAGARNSDGALEFVRFAAQPEQLERLALGQGKISPLKHWSDEFMEKHSNPHIREFRAILDSARFFHDPRVPGWLGYLDKIKEAFAGVWTGGKDPRRALADLSG